MLGVLFLVRRYVQGGSRVSSSLIEVELLGQRSLGPRRSVQVLKVLDRVLVVGVSEQGMQSLAELSADGALEELRQERQAKHHERTQSWKAGLSGARRARVCRTSAVCRRCPAGKARPHGGCQRMKLCVFVLAVMMLVPALGAAQEQVLPLPKLSVEVGKATSPEDVSVTLQILLLMTILSLAPAILILTTSFTRIIVVLHFLRQAMGTQQVPPPQVLVGLALFLTFFLMAPTWNRINTEALQPYLEKKLSLEEAYTKGIDPLREFMLKQTREEDLGLFMRFIDGEKPATREDVPTHALIPAFALSELRTGFQIGFLLFVPFLVIDMVVASVLMSMGMMMLPPVLISLPFKILLFVLVDGWRLVVESVMNSVR